MAIWQEMMHFHSRLNLCVPLLCGMGRPWFLLPLLSHSFTVFNSEQFKVGWDFLPSAINAALYSGPRDTESIVTASSGVVYVGEARERDEDREVYMLGK